jgi:uncharacterized delta-60 repeat protein
MKKLIMTACLLLAGALALTEVVAVSAAVGGIDTSFNVGGAGVGGDSVFGVVVQPDGKIIVGGTFTIYNGDAATPDHLLRLNANGTRDTTFNPGGAGFNGSVASVALQPDGKIIVGGNFNSYNNTSTPIAVVRLNADGTRDTTFNPGGTGATGALGLQLVDALLVQPDGKILVGGNFLFYNGDDAAPDNLLRLNADGSRDTTFNPGGAGTNNGVLSLALQPDGKIIVGGTFTIYNGDAAAPDYLLRLNANGTRDTTFNPGGAGFSDTVHAVALQPDGKLIVGGSFNAYNGNDAAPNCVLRLNADGTRDTAFNPGGLGFVTAFNPRLVAALLVQPDGKILVGGSFFLVAYNNDSTNPVPNHLMRLNADGTHDTTFNTGGSGLSKSGSPAKAGTLALQSDGKILVGGQFDAYNDDAAAPDNLLRLTGSSVKDNQTITVNTHAPANAAYGTSFTVAATSDSGLPVSYSSAGTCTNVGATFTITSGTGTCTVRYDQAGNTAFNAAPQVTETVTAQKAGQTITFNGPADKSYGSADFNVSATASSNLAVGFAASGQCTVNGTTVHITGVGSCTLTASQGGNENYNAATDVARTFQIGKASTATAVSTSLNPAAVGQTVTFTATVTSTAGTPTGTVQFKVDNVNLGEPAALGADGKASVSTSALTAGQHAVTAVYAGDASFNTSNGSLLNGQWALTFSGLLSFKGEGNEPNELDFAVSLSPACTLPVSVSYTTVDGTAVAPSDYEAKTGTISFLPGETTRHFPITINGDTAYEESEEFYVDYSLGGFKVARSRGIVFNDDPTGGVIEFEQATYNVAEGGSLTVKVKHTLYPSVPVDVDYTTDDGSVPGVTVPCSSTTGLALDRCDYTKALGTLHFAANETEKTITLLTGQDSYVEGLETFQLKLSHPRGNAALGPKAVATVTVVDDSPESAGNAIDDTDNFVRQHYLDFLNREPDSSGFQFWRNGINVCGADVACREVKRIDTSAAFFLSIEFQETGYLVYRMFKTAYGDATSPNVAGTVPVIRFDEFMPDTQHIGEGVVVGAGTWQQQLEANKRAYALEFVQRARFVSAFPASMTTDEFVAKLDENAGGVLSTDERAQLVASLGATPADAAKRAAAVRQVAEHAQLRQREFNRAFVLMQYYGYLRRDPDAAPNTDFSGWKFWLGKLEEFGGDYRRAEMVKAFIQSIEYRQRFGQ